MYMYAYVRVCVYVCMCMYLCMYVCTYVCMSICMHVSLLFYFIFFNYYYFFFFILLYITHLCSGFSWLFHSQFLTTHLEKRYGNLMFLVSMFIAMVTKYYSMYISSIVKRGSWNGLGRSSSKL